MAGEEGDSRRGARESVASIILYWYCRRLKMLMAVTKTD